MGAGLQPRVKESPSTVPYLPNPFEFNTLPVSLPRRTGLKHYVVALGEPKSFPATIPAPPLTPFLRLQLRKWPQSGRFRVSPFRTDSRLTRQPCAPATFAGGGFSPSPGETRYWLTKSGDCPAPSRTFRNLMRSGDRRALESSCPPSIFSLKDEPGSGSGVAAAGPPF